MDKIYSRPRIRFFKINSRNSNGKNSNVSKKNQNKKRKIIQIIIVLLISLFTANTIINAINPIMDKKCEYLAKSIATKISNEQATIVMSKYKYEDLCSVSKDVNGNVSMISANVIPINEIISNITVRIQGELNKKENDYLKIRLGSFTGIKILSGRGPNVNIKMSTIGDLETELKSEFISSGINQTVHKIYLKIDCNVSILTPFNTIEEKIENQILLAEAVIIGTTPETYYNFNNANDDIALETIQ